MPKATPPEFAIVPIGGKKNGTFRTIQLKCGCNKVFLSKGALKQHQKTTQHGNWKCMDCKSPFPSKFALNQHCAMKKHAKQSAPKMPKVDDGTVVSVGKVVVDSVQNATKSIALQLTGIIMEKLKEKMMESKTKNDAIKKQLQVESKQARAFLQAEKEKMLENISKEKDEVSMAAKK